MEGITLREALQRRPLSIERTRSILTQVGQALAAAHRVAVLHLDLKPENIILAEPRIPAERASVIDFGTARLKDMPVVGKAVTGSPRYMAPEMTKPKIDPRLDPLRGDARFTDLVRRVGLTP